MSSRERFLTASIAYADADADNAQEYARAADNCLRLAEIHGRRQAVEKIKARLAQLKAEGKKLGRPSTVTLERVLEVLPAAGSIAKTAALLGASKWAVIRALRKARR